MQFSESSAKKEGYFPHRVVPCPKEVGVFVRQVAAWSLPASRSVSQTVSQSVTRPVRRAAARQSAAATALGFRV